MYNNSTVKQNSVFKKQGNYTYQEWDIREDYFRDLVINIKIPKQPTPAHITSLLSEIDNALTVARLDMTTMKRSFESWEGKYKILEKELFSKMKYQIPQGAQSPPKRTETEIKSMVAKELSTIGTVTANKLNLSMSLSDVVALYRYRYSYMQSIVDILKDKHDLLITESSMLKLISSVGGNNGHNPSQSSNT